MTSPPTHGARIECELDSSDATTARYRVTLALPDSTHVGTATLDAAAKRVDLSPFDPPTDDPWVLDTARSQLRTLLADAPDWPKRIHRWRAPR